MRIIAGVITLAIILIAVAFAKDLNVFEDGSFTGTIPGSQAWRD